MIINNSMTDINALTRQPEEIDYSAPSQYRFSIIQLPKVQFFTTACNIPGVNMGDAIFPTPFTDVPVQGDKLTFDNLIISFIVDESLENITLVIGEDFEALPLIPKTFEEVDARARPSLPVSEKLLGSDEEASGVINLVKPFLSVRQGDISPMKLVKEIDGQPPSGQKCG